MTDTDTSSEAGSSKSVVVTVFKKPLDVPVKRPKRFNKTVLDEESYVRQVEGIIERDFFPSLKRMRVQNDYLEAMRSKDDLTLERLRAKYSGTGRPTTAPPSPATFETPEPDARPTGTPQRQTPSATPAEQTGELSAADELAAPALSLDAYMSTHSSEDNESFEEMMEEQQRRQERLQPWLFNTEAAHNERQRALLSADVPALEQQADVRRRPGQVASWPYRARNDLMYVPQSRDATAAEKVQQARGRQLVVHASTRMRGAVLPSEQRSRELLQQAADTQQRRLHGKIGLDGREMLSAAAAGRHPLVRTPSPAPGVDVDASPLMTWGEIDGTPFRLDGGETPLLHGAAMPNTPAFTMAQPPNRERLALRLAERNSARHRDKKEKALEAARRSVQAASPLLGASVQDRLASMSPAARRLAQLGGRSGTDNALRQSYTPARGDLGGTPTPVVAAAGTPTLRTGATTPAAEQLQTPLSRITDNLLSLPKRKKAADFFM